MTIVDPVGGPLPTTLYGKADWVDYTNYWREKDAEWIQQRIILKYADAAARLASQGATPPLGTLVYNESSLGANLDRLEMFSKQHNAWVPLLMLANITSTKDDATGVSLSHRLAAGKGVSFEPARTVMDNPIHVMGGVLTVDATGVSIKTGTKTVKLTTDATSLVSDSPVSATALSATGAIAGGSLNVTGAATLPNITMSGTLSGGGVLNGGSGTIGSVALGTAVAHGSGGVRADTQGFHAQQGAFYGDSTSAILRQRNPSGGAYGTAYAQVTGTEINLTGTNINAWGSLRNMNGRSVVYHNTNNTVAWNGGPVIVQTSDPGVANVPEGTIWVNA